MSTRPPPAQIALGLFGLLMVGALLTLRSHANAVPALCATTAVAVASATLVGYLRTVGSRPCARCGWTLATAAVVAYACGAVAWNIAYVLGARSSAGHVSDALYLAAYPLFAGALLVFARNGSDRNETTVRQLLDAAIIFAAAFATLWVFDLAHDALESGRAPADAMLTTLYPALDLLVLALVVRLAVTTGRWPRALVLFAVGLTGLLVTDFVWRNRVADGDLTPASLVAPAFMVSFVLVGLAILDPSARGLTTAEDRVRTRAAPRWGLLAILMPIALVPAAIVVFAAGRLNSPADRIVFGAFVALLPILIIVRLGDLLVSLTRATADLDLVIESSPVPIAVVDRSGTVEMWNPAAARVSGYPAVDVIGGVAPVFAAESVDRVARLYLEALAGVRLDEVEVKLDHRDGHVVDVRVSAAPLNDGAGRIVALFEDVTQERRHREQLEFLARHDALTGLPNRMLFGERLEAALQADGDNATYVVLLDMDNFSSLNETAGLVTGDAVLRELSGVLEASIRPGDTLARLSGDEFALILAGVSKPGPEPIVERALDAVRGYRWSSVAGDLDITASAGIYTIAAADTPDVVLRRVDEALYHAKAKGKNRLECWSPDASPTIHAARTWSPVIKDALTEGRLALYVQPIVGLVSRGVVHYEALARLVAPDGTVAEAGAWIEHAEQLGMMPAIDGRMLELAKAFLREHRHASLLVNISPSSFQDAGLIEQLADTLQALPPGRLGIEITEHTALRHPEETARTIRRLQDLGAVVAIDDFGLGFTSFRDLATIPCDLVKIPGQLAASAVDRPVVARAIASVAHHYGRAVVLEGIETEEEAAEARLLGIQYGQGWHFGRPVPAATMGGSSPAPTARPVPVETLPETPAARPVVAIPSTPAA